MEQSVKTETSVPIHRRFLGFLVALAILGHCDIVLPAVFCLLAMCFLILAYTHASRSWSAKQRYESALSQSIKNREWSAARVVCDALLAKRPDDFRYLFQRALIAEEQQEPELARAILNRCAPLDGPGHGPARLVIAQQLIKQSDVSSAKKQLELAVQQAPLESVYAIELGRLLIATGDVDDGLKTLEAVAGDDPGIRLQMGVLYQQRQLAAEANRSFRMAATSANRKWESTHEPQFAILAIEAWRSSGDLDQAEQFARLWWQQAHDYQPARDALARCWVQRAEKYRQAQDSKSQWELLEKVLTLSPNNVSALSQVSELAFTASESGEQANQTINRMLSSGQAPTIVHTILGTKAAQANEWKKAALHLDQAKAQNPSAPIILNNLAWVLANAEPPQLEKAKLVSLEAVKLAPQLPDTYDTYGLVLLKLGEAQNAITYFEKALKLRPEHLPYRRRLAEAYLAAGDLDSAQRIQSGIDQEKK